MPANNSRHYFYTMSDNNLVKAIKGKGKTIEAEMSFFGHLEALRWHLMRAALAVIVFTIVAFWNFDFIYREIIEAPFHPDFWSYRLMCYLGTTFHVGGLCVNKINGELTNNEMAGQF